MRRDFFLKALTTLLILIGIAYFVNAFLNVLGNLNIPVDQALRYWEIKKLFFEGKNIFLEDNFLTYPPSFLLLITPLIALFDYQTSKWVWFLVQFVSLSTLIWVTYLVTSKMVEHTKALFLASLVFAWHSSYQTIGIGQLPVVLMTFFIVGFLIVLFKKDNNISITIFVILLFTITLGKYTIFLPIYVFLLFHRVYRKYILSSFLLNFIISSAIIFWFGLSYNEYLTLYLGKYGGGYNSGSFDLHSILRLLDIPTLGLILASVFMLTIPIFMGIRNYSLLSGLIISSIVARFWMYHGIYDNIMLYPILFLLVLHFKKNLSPWSFSTLSLLMLFLVIPARFWDGNGIFSTIIHLVFPFLCVVVAVVTYQKRDSLLFLETPPWK